MATAHVESPAAVVPAQPSQEAGGAAALLARFVATLEREGVPYCVTHGYEQFPRRVDSDVDCVFPEQVLPGRLAAVLAANREALGAEVVDWRAAGTSHYIVLAGRDETGAPCFLHLHASGGYELARRTIMTAKEVLYGRRRSGGIWVPAPAVEFACLLARRIGKMNLPHGDLERLAELYEQDPRGVAEWAERLLGNEGATLVRDALAAGEVGVVLRRMPQLRACLLRNAARRHPASLLASGAGAARRRLRRLFVRDAGLNVVLLGPDGVGKSSAARIVRGVWKDAFAGVRARSFPPALRGTNRGTRSAPHDEPPRSPLASAFRAVTYWFGFSTVGHYFTVRRDLVRSALVVHDRHFADTLVDAKRYRYAGPAWLLRGLWRLVPKPDLVILLDAPPDVIQARKAEVPPEETMRQCAAYRALVATLNGGFVVDANRPPGAVAADVHRIIGSFLAARVARRIGKAGVA